MILNPIDNVYGLINCEKKRFIENIGKGKMR
jgi:hypothetical protein